MSFWEIILIWGFVALGGILLIINLSVQPWKSPRRQFEGQIKDAFRSRKSALIDRLFDTRRTEIRSLRLEVALVLVMDTLFIVGMGLVIYALL